MEALTEQGRADVAYEMVNQSTFPGWGFMLENGATTLWEHWEYSDNVFSHNHPMFGSVSEWFYKALGGISPAPEAVGFDKIMIRPQLVGDLKWVKAEYDSVHGRVVSEWKRESGKLVLRVRVPMGATATVYLPATDPARVRESGRALERVKGVRVLKTEPACAVLAVESGEYRFVAEAP